MRYRRRITDIADRGYERIEGEVVQGVTDLSIPIVDASGVSLALLDRRIAT